MNRIPQYLLQALAALALAAAAAAQSPQPSASRMEWFNEARFGMFIHWGVYSVPAGEWNGRTNYAEWIQQQARIPNAEYEKLDAQFNPVKFDAKEWVHVAKDAGMKYLVITAKHHDGFSMYDSKLTDYTIVKATPFKRDPMKELAAAAREAGLKFCFYYSDPDWHHPDFPARYSQSGFHGNANPDADLEKYVAYMKGQVRELLTGYGPIGIMWFDGGGSFSQQRQQMPQLLHAREMLDMIHELQPQCLVNNRLGLPADYGTPEQRIPGGKQTNSFEVCMTLNGHWGYNKNDKNWKSSKVVIQNLADIASKGGNYLLNVGPTSEGLFPDESVRILGEVGRWMNVNGDSIYGTGASPLDTAPAWGRVTRTAGKLYLHVFDWPPDGQLAVGPLKSRALRAYLLAGEGRKTLPMTRIADGPADTVGTIDKISLPAQALDPRDTVVVLEGTGGAN